MDLDDWPVRLRCPLPTLDHPARPDTELWLLHDWTQAIPITKAYRLGQTASQAMAMDDIEQRGHERRKFPRSRMLGLAKISLGDPDKLMACVVQDCSRGGARLQLADAARCPDSFVLIGADDWIEDCEVAWRRDDLIGVRFVKAMHPAIRWVEAEAQRQADAKAMDGIRSGVNERRQFPRTRVAGVGKITVSEQEPSIDCIVIDWSHGGAQLRLVEPDKCPDKFEIITKDGGITDCLVVWRRDAYVGVRFLKP